jgi:hypothetical protein
MITITLPPSVILQLSFVFPDWRFDHHSISSVFSECGSPAWTFLVFGVAFWLPGVSTIGLAVPPLWDALQSSHCTSWWSHWS